jgi:uncharacterized protein YfdQ (DUF2303 family)
MPEFTELSATSAAGDAAAIIQSTEEKTVAALDIESLGSAYPDLSRTVVPSGWAEKIHDLEQYAEFPRRKKANPTFQTTESLARYINDHRTPGTTVYADPDHLKIVAILDDHIPSRTDASNAQHRTHQATLTLVRTPGCERWINAHGKYLDQVVFAQMIEDGITEIATPPGAELLEIAQTIQSSTTVDFRSGHRLATGQTSFTYAETGDARAGQAGELVIPEMITLVFVPFFGAAPVQIDARLRYQIREGHLKLGVWLVRHVEILREAFELEAGRLGDLTEETDSDGPTGVLPILYGTP